MDKKRHLTHVGNAAPSFLTSVLTAACAFVTAFFLIGKMDWQVRFDLSSPDIRLLSAGFFAVTTFVLLRVVAYACWWIGETRGSPLSERLLPIAILTMLLASHLFYVSWRVALVIFFLVLCFLLPTRKLRSRRARERVERDKLIDNTLKLDSE